jgi:hypothetical protein
MIDRIWRTSTYSGNGANDCVELTVGVEETAVRDSKDRAGGHLTFSRRAFEAFLADPKPTRG